MSEAAPERARPQAVPAREAPGGGNVLTKKVGPLPTWAWLGIIGIGGAAVWYFYKSRQASAANAAAGTATAGSAGNCTDTNGDTVPCDQVDYGGQIATLQTEIQDLQGQDTGTSTSTSTSTGTTSTGTGTGTTSTGTGTGTGTTAKPPASGPGLPGPVAGLRASKVNRTSVTLTWDKAAGATAYYVQLTYQSKTIASRTVATTSTIFTGIRPDSSMDGHVSAKNASGQGPTAQVAFHTPK